MKEHLRTLDSLQLQRIARKSNVPLSRLSLWMSDQCALTCDQIDAIEHALGDLEVAQTEIERVFGR